MKTQSHDRLCIFWSSSDPTANDYTEKFFTDFFPTWYRASIKKKMESKQPTPSPLEQYASYPFDTDEIYQVRIQNHITPRDLSR